MKILIADDSKLSRTKLSSSLVQLGHHVIEASSGEEAVTLFQTQSPDLVILDVVMGGMSGFECATILRQIKKDWIPIIFLSSSIDDEHISMGIDAGGDDYLPKPFSHITLSAKIKAMQRIADMRAELIETTKKLARLSSTDVLTGLYNRMQFEKKFIAMFDKVKQDKSKFALLFVDIDHFKEVNDQLGHHMGDLLLKEVSTRLIACLRKDDFIARLGGDEFAIIIHPIERVEIAEEIAQKILKQAQKPYIFEDKTLSITFSIGVAFYPEAGINPETFLINADYAMYYVKRKGRNNYQIFRSGLKEQEKI